jgi:hypothetical protein
MFVAYVWPFRELPESLERKTFFWLECTYDEAIEVLQRVSISSEDFKSFLNHLYEFRANGLGERDLDEWLSVYTRVGFLISEDGAIVKWAPPGYPISNQWDAYNPFKSIHPIEVKSFDEFKDLAKEFANTAPYYSNLDDESQIVDRFKPDKFKGANPNSFLRELVQTSELARTGVKVFFERYCEGATIGELEYFNSDPVVQGEHVHLYLDLSRANSRQSPQNEPAAGIDFTQINLREIFARKRRAIQNLRKLENIIKGENGVTRGSPLEELKRLSDDEICELALLMERYTSSPAIKWILGEFIERLRPVSSHLRTRHTFPFLMVHDDDIPSDFVLHTRICFPERQDRNGGISDLFPPVSPNVDEDPRLT